jgi:hypothetical protein
MHNISFFTFNTHEQIITPMKLRVIKIPITYFKQNEKQFLNKGICLPSDDKPSKHYENQRHYSLYYQTVHNNSILGLESRIIIFPG